MSLSEPLLGLSRLVDLLQAYDKWEGTWPEHYLEGWAIYEFLCQRLGVEPMSQEAWVDAMEKRPEERR